MAGHGSTWTARALYPCAASPTVSHDPGFDPWFDDHACRGLRWAGETGMELPGYSDFFGGRPHRPGVAEADHWSQSGGRLVVFKLRLC